MLDAFNVRLKGSGRVCDGQGNSAESQKRSELRVDLAEPACLCLSASSSLVHVVRVDQSYSSTSPTYLIAHAISHFLSVAFSKQNNYESDGGYYDEVKVSCGSCSFYKRQIEW